MAEATTNIASHICARIFSKAPATYGDSFSILADNNVISKSLAARLGKVVGFRNLLVHRYEIIDDRKMLEMMRDNLRDIWLYLKDITVYLSERYFDQCWDLAAALSLLAGFPVDIHALNQSSPGFRYHATNTNRSSDKFSMIS